MSKATNRQNQNRNTKMLIDFCHKYHFEFKELNQGFQYRVEGILDIYPVRGRYHSLTTQDRGSWRTAEDLHRILLAAIPVRMLETKTLEQITPFGVPAHVVKNLPEAQLEYPKTDGFYEVGQQPQVMNILTPPKPESWWKRLIRRFRRGKA